MAAKMIKKKKKKSIIISSAAVVTRRRRQQRQRQISENINQAARVAASGGSIARHQHRQQ